MKRDFYIVLMTERGPAFVVDSSKNVMKFPTAKAARDVMRRPIALKDHPSEQIWYVVGFDVAGGVVEYGQDVFGPSSA